MSVKRKYMESHLQMTEYVSERRMDVSICTFNLTTLKAPARTQLIMDDTVVGVKIWPYGRLGRYFGVTINKRTNGYGKKLKKYQSAQTYGL